MGCVVLVLMQVGCSKERKAERIHREAAEAVERDDLDAATELLQELIRKYPETRQAELARDELATYQGLLNAKIVYPVRQAQDLMVATGRALERYRWRHRGYPAALSGLVPKYLDGEPLDPWGRSLVYKKRRGGRGYTLTCLGADGVAGGEGTDGDLVVRDGKFVLGSTE